MSKVITTYITQRVNEWVGLDTTFTEEQIHNLLWALTMDEDLFETLKTQVVINQAEEFIARLEAEDEDEQPNK